MVIAAEDRVEVRKVSEISERDERILRLRSKGLTLQAIADKMGVTRERVRQVIKKHGGVTAEELKQRTLDDGAQEDGAVRSVLRTTIEARPGSTAEELAEAIGRTPAEVRAAIPAELRNLVVQAARTVEPLRWSTELMLSVLRDAATYEFPLTATAYANLVRVGEIDGPSVPLIARRFGSWIAACEAAGVEHAESARTNYQSMWTDADLLGEVRRYLTSPGSKGTFADYTRWVATQDDAPSGPTLRNRLGGWLELKRRALLVTAHDPDGQALMATETRAPNGEVARVDRYLADTIDPSTRIQIWESINSIIRHGPTSSTGSDRATGLALGYVQSGKTTSITALIASAADAGYRVVIAILGSTNLLLDQNRGRLEGAFGIGVREDYRWVVETNPSGVAAGKRIADWLDRGRIVLVPVLKHAGRIRALTAALEQVGLGDLPTLIVDDEADQASLNTQASNNAESKTYEALRELREQLPRHLYVQYTATPYAPLLLEADDLLLPEFVEFLHPGPGYTGGREFFVDFADKVVRDVPALEEQAAKNLPLALPKSLVKAFGSFVVGAALLLHQDKLGAPVSMLVHSTQRNDVQARYHFLLERQVRAWRETCEGANTFDDIPEEIREERLRLVSLGAPDAPDDELLAGVQGVLREVTLWLINSTSALNKVDWKVAPIHVLVGGNKLDRGYTIEGLTVTYMNRPTSPQLDTMEQRARAFGYRRDQLPYCQFFATKRTVKVLRDTVFTEYDLRARLQDHIDEGGTVETWAKEIGLLLPEGMKPTRDTVVQALSTSLSGWHSLRRPALDAGSLAANRELVERSGLLVAERVDYGRLAHRTVHLPLAMVMSDLIEPWATSGYSAGWRHDDIVNALQRHPEQGEVVQVVLLEEGSAARTRKWDDDTGFLNLFQGRDAARQGGGPLYPGDLAVPGIQDDPDRVAVQIHRVTRRDRNDAFEILTPAIYLGSRPIVRKL